MSDWTDEYRTMCEDCEKRESRLTEWEQNFVQSITEQLDAMRSLTAKQIETLEMIWEKATKKG